MPDPDLRPMLLMVCSRCRDGTHTEMHTVFCEEPGCVFQGKARTKRGDLKAARTREEMVEAATDALSPHLDSRCGQCAGTGDDLRSNLDCTSCGATGYRFPVRGRKAAAEALIAARVIEEEERDASV